MPSWPVPGKCCGRRTAAAQDGFAIIRDRGKGQAAFPGQAKEETLVDRETETGQAALTKPGRKRTSRPGPGKSGVDGDGIGMSRFAAIRYTKKGNGAGDANKKIPQGSTGQVRVAQKRKGFQRAGLLQSTGQSVPGKSGAGSAAGARIPGGKGAFCKRQAKLSDIGAKRVSEQAAARGGVPRDAEKEKRSKCHRREKAAGKGIADCL